MLVHYFLINDSPKNVLEFCKISPGNRLEICSVTKFSENVAHRPGKNALDVAGNLYHITLGSAGYN